MNVLVVTTAYPTPDSPASGVFVREHARAAARHNDVAVLHLDRSHTHRGLPRLQRLEGEELPTWRVTYAWSPTPLSTLLHFVAAARGFRAVRRAGFVPDVVHAHFFLAAVPAALFSRAPLVVSEHWSVFLPEDPMELTPLLRRAAGFAYRRADVVLPVSEALQHGIEAHGLTAKRFEVVRNVVDTELFTDGSPARNGRPIAVGLLYEAKGYDVLLRAVDELDGVELDVVGDGPLRDELERMANGHVHFHGLLPKPEVARMMREAQLFVLASRYDNNPCAVMEALAAGLPVVATAVGGVPELVTEANGRLAQPGDPHRLAREIRAALDTEYDRAAISADARARYGMDAIGDELDRVYESVRRR